MNSKNVLSDIFHFYKSIFAMINGLNICYCIHKLLHIQNVRSQVLSTSEVLTLYKPIHTIVLVFNYSYQRRIQRRRTGRAPPVWIILRMHFLKNFDIITRINFIAINTKCLQYLFYSLLSLQKHRVCVKGHQNALRPKKNYTAPGLRPPVLKFLDPPLHITTYTIWLLIITKLSNKN